MYFFLLEIRLKGSVEDIGTWRVTINGSDDFFAMHMFLGSIWTT